MGSWYGSSLSMAGSIRYLVCIGTALLKHQFWGSMLVQIPGNCNTGRPGGVSGYPRAWYRSVSFVSSRAAECILVWIRGDFFLCTNWLLRKARERELATLDEKSTSSGIAEPLRAKKTEGKNRGGKRDDTCDHGLLFSWKVEVCKKWMEINKYRYYKNQMRSCSCEIEDLVKTHLRKLCVWNSNRGYYCCVSDISRYARSQETANYKHR